MSPPNRNKNSVSSLHPATLSVHDPHDSRHYGAVKLPIYQNSLFTFETYEQFDAAMRDVVGNPVYSRGNNPTVDALGEAIAELENGEAARCFASGMAAISSAVLSVVSAGDHIVCVDQAYGPTREFCGTYLQKFGIETTFVDGTSLEAIAEAMKPNTKLLYLESPTTFHFRLQNLRACAQLARERGIATVIDNTWATPVYQRPLELGIDLVVHSASKYFGGHSDAIGGIVVGSHERIRRLSERELLLFGGIMTAQTADLIMRGVRTLHVRLESQQRTALRIAGELQRVACVACVNYPGLPDHPQHELARTQMTGFSSLLSFECAYPPARLKQWANALRLFRIGVSWGGHESLATVFPLSVTDDRVLVRLYLGLEHPQDLLDDLLQAFDAADLPR